MYSIEHHPPMRDSREGAMPSRVEELTAEPLMIRLLQKTVCKGTPLFSFCIIRDLSLFVKGTKKPPPTEAVLFFKLSVDLSASPQAMI